MIRSIVFVPDAWEAYVFWQGQDKKTQKRINQLIQTTCGTPFDGIGKPEPLKENLTGYWSRRIADDHRLVYRVTDTEIVIVACRYHYGE